MIQKFILFQGLLFYKLSPKLADGHQRQQVIAEPVLQHRERHPLLQRQHQQHDLAGGRRDNHPRLQVHLRRAEPHAGCRLWRRYFPKQQRQPLHRKGDWLRQEREHTCSATIRANGDFVLWLDRQPDLYARWQPAEPGG